MPQVEPSYDTGEQPEALLSNYVNIEQLAILLNPGNPVSERSVYNEMDRLKVPFVKILNVRWYDRDKVKAAILACEVCRQPPKRGRPRRAG
jgi:hypothetical protein